MKNVYKILKLLNGNWTIIVNGQPIGFENDYLTISALVFCKLQPRDKVFVENGDEKTKFNFLEFSQYWMNESFKK